MKGYHLKYTPMFWFFCCLRKMHCKDKWAPKWIDTKWEIKKKFCDHHHHHHQEAVCVARIPFTLRCNPSPSAHTLHKYSWWHPLSAQSRWVYIFAGQPKLVCPCVRVHRRMSLLNSSLLDQQYPGYLDHLTWMVFMMGDKWS